MADYPKRPTHFAHRVIRLMARVCAAQEIGTDGAWLVAIIAHTEHAKWYSSAVTFWNDQLMSVAGFTIGQLVRARKKAIDGGWLHYEAGGKGKVGRYWVCVPTQYEGLPDGAVDADPHAILFKNEQENERETEEKRKTTEGETEEKCATFIPTPTPAPNSVYVSECEGQPVALMTKSVTPFEERLGKARQVAESLPMPRNAKESRHRDALAHWIVSREGQHGAFNVPAWSAACSVYGHLTADQWHVILMRSAADATKNLATYAHQTANKAAESSNVEF